MNPCKDDYCILKDASVKTAMVYKNNRLNRRLI